MGQTKNLHNEEGIKKIKELVEKDEAVINVRNIFSTYQSPEEVILMLLVQFKHELECDEISAAIHRIRDIIKDKFPLVEFVLIQPQ